MNRDTLLVYGAGANQVPILEAGRRRGWRVIAVDRNPEALGSSLADRFVCASLRDHEAIARAVEHESLCGVVARVTDRVALDSARRLSDQRGLAAPCSRLLAAATSKRSLAEICAASDLSTPARFATSTGEIARRGVPVIVRPDVTLRGKAGIHRVDDVARFEERVAQAAAASENGEVDVSEWLEGGDVSVLARLDWGRALRIALWDEWVAVAPDGRIEGIGCGMPSHFETATPEIDRMLDALAEAFPESRCLITLSLRIDAAGRPFIIEIHLGVGGDALADQLLPAALPGFDAIGSLVTISSAGSWSPPTERVRPHGLLREGAGWSLVEARDARSLRALARARIPRGWELPCSLRVPVGD